MSRTRISSGYELEEAAAYSRAVVDGEWVFVSGTTGFDYATGEISDDPAEQARQCFRNIASALEEAGASMDDAVRVRYVVTDRDYLEPCIPVFREAFEKSRPAAMAIIAGLADPKMKIEIEVTALKRGLGS